MWKKQSHHKQLFWISRTTIQLSPSTRIFREKKTSNYVDQRKRPLLVTSQRRRKVLRPLTRVSPRHLKTIFSTRTVQNSGLATPRLPAHTRVPTTNTKTVAITSILSRSTIRPGLRLISGRRPYFGLCASTLGIMRTRYYYYYYNSHNRKDGRVIYSANFAPSPFPSRIPRIGVSTTCRGFQWRSDRRISSFSSFTPAAISRNMNSYGSRKNLRPALNKKGMCPQSF